jgi:hypothetical protein
MSLMMHCGGTVVTRDQLFDIKLPPKTATYCPIAHSDLLEMTEDSIRKTFGSNVEIDAAYGLANDGSRFFSVLGIKLDSEESGLAIGLRNALDKQLTAAVAVGSNVFVCSNLAFESDGINVFRKHTPNIARDIRTMIDSAIELSPFEYQRIADGWEEMKAIPCSLDEGFEKIGLAMGHKILTSTQASAAVREWKVPTHDAFRARNVYGLNAAFTHSAKLGRPELLMPRHAAISNFFKSIN